MNKLSVSGLSRAESCPISRHLPQQDLDSTDVYAAKGARIHDEIERGANNFDPSVSIDVAAVAAAVPDLFYAGKKEVPVALNPAAGTARLLTVTGHRAYDVEPGEIPGTIDCVLDADELTVADWKTGITWYGRPSESLQLGAYAVAYALATGRPLTEGARLTYIYVREGQAAVESERVEDLTPILERIRAIVTERPDPKAAPGDHCRYCPSRRFCPAYLLGGSVPMVAPSLATIPSDKWGEVVDYVELMEKVAKQLRNELETYVDDHGQIPLGSHVYTSQLVQRETVDTAIALPLVRLEIVEAKISKSALSPEELEAVRNAGGIKQSSYKRYYRRKQTS